MVAPGRSFLEKNMSDYQFPCPLAKKCGGCQLTNLPHSEQLKLKEKQVTKLLGRYCRVQPIITGESPFYYRNKVQAAFGITRGGMVISGVYQSSTHKIVKMDQCMLDDPRADAIIVTIRELLIAFKLSVYNERNGSGLLRHVLVKVAKGTGEIMVVLVTGTAAFKSKNDFCRALIKKHPEITTIIQNVNDKFTSLVLGERETVLYGNGYITDQLLGKQFRISSRSFYQINYDVTRLLYSTVIEYASLKPDSLVIDVYSGVGTIGMLLSDTAGAVLSVENNPDAVRDAKVNAKLNNIKNMRFLCADATECLKEMAKNGENADVVVMDPPRAGSTPAFIRSVCTLSPKRVVYASCNPETLARDLQLFIRLGYHAKKCQPFDMFPNTNHVETVVLMTKE